MNDYKNWHHPYLIPGEKVRIDANKTKDLPTTAVCVKEFPYHYQMQDKYPFCINKADLCSIDGHVTVTPY